jgi:hypothetical protein
MSKTERPTKLSLTRRPIPAARSPTMGPRTSTRPRGEGRRPDVGHSRQQGPPGGVPTEGKVFGFVLTI